VESGEGADESGLPASVLALPGNRKSKKRFFWAEQGRENNSIARKIKAIVSELRAINLVMMLGQMFNVNFLVTAKIGRFTGKKTSWLCGNRE